MNLNTLASMKSSLRKHFEEVFATNIDGAAHLAEEN